MKPLEPQEWKRMSKDEKFQIFLKDRKWLGGMVNQEFGINLYIAQ